MEEEAGGGTDAEETNAEGEAPPGLRVQGALSWSPGWRKPQSHSYSSKKTAWTELCSLGSHSSCRGSALGRPVSKRWPRAPLVPGGLGPRAGADRQLRAPDPRPPQGTLG